jgi:hypothetical protein
MSGKQAPEGRSEPSPKRMAINLGMQRRVTCKYEGGQSLSVVSTVNTIEKGAGSLTEHTNFISHLTHVCMYVCLSVIAVFSMSVL